MLAGTALGSAAAYATQRAQWLREHAHQWDDRRQALYADFIATCDKSALEIQMTHNRVIERDEGKLFSGIFDAGWPLRASVELIASPSVAEAAKVLHDCLVDAATSSDGADSGPYAAARTDLLSAMRRELDVT